MIPLRLLVSGVFAFSVLGCAPSKTVPKDPSIPVKGVVKLNGKPLPGGQITFHGEGDKSAKVSAGINGEGQYDLAVPAGTYKVTVDNTSLKPSASAGGNKPSSMPGIPGMDSRAGATSTPVILPGGSPSEMPGMVSTATKYVQINANYHTPDKSGLSTTVQGTSHTYDVDLK